MAGNTDLPPSIAMVLDPGVLTGGLLGGDPYHMLTQGKSAAETTGPTADDWRTIAPSHSA